MHKKRAQHQPYLVRPIETGKVKKLSLTAKCHAAIKTACAKFCTRSCPHPIEPCDKECKELKEFRKIKTEEIRNKLRGKNEK